MLRNDIGTYIFQNFSRAGYNFCFLKINERERGYKKLFTLEHNKVYSSIEIFIYLYFLFYFAIYYICSKMLKISMCYFYSNYQGLFE